jgi:Calcineurin-like phosphoesterase
VSALRIAVIADIHGNLPALEAALDDIERHNVDRTINLGDRVSGPFWGTRSAYGEGRLDYSWRAMTDGCRSVRLRAEGEQAIPQRSYTCAARKSRISSI